jgi:hypothetical protein
VIDWSGVPNHAMKEKSPRVIPRGFLFYVEDFLVRLRKVNNSFIARFPSDNKQR